jgi:L-fuculose-phosphate aldolase
MQVKEENELRKQIVDCGLSLLESGLVQGTWGNISVRLDDDRMLCTPSGIAYTDLTPEDMAIVDLHTLEYEGSRKPTSEKTFHAAIYLAKPEAGAIIHTHSKYCCIYAACEMPMRIKDKDAAARLGERIQCGKYALSGTKRLKNSVIEALGDSRACTMSHHGMVVYGSDLADAEENCRLLEHIAEQEINRRWKLFADD